MNVVLLQARSKRLSVSAACSIFITETRADTSGSLYSTLNPTATTKVTGMPSYAKNPFFQQNNPFAYTHG